ncbi:MAG: LON peptidase substrate-binding domain-containing protein [Candidatus Rokubacteria bacterium]|nr:LON peptidase substrate-binding domain-containing protein [Candidatus Rokubacteria bacterium]MBI3824371.1 LON peptidase substrate-binding domain-containing protein [Candidatus Rokubacteria bacterium]
MLPLFPLPDVTFFPSTFMPLHVFEARYRALVTDALARDRRLAVVKLKPGFEKDYDGRPAVHAVAGAGEIVNWERLSTGRYNIVVKGEHRVRFEHELPADTLYRLARARVLEEEPATADVTAVVERVRAACQRLLRVLERPADVMETALAASQPPGVIADRAAAAFLPDPTLRQSLLETLDVSARLDGVSAALDRLLEELEGQRGNA